MISVHFQGKPFNIKVYALTNNAEEDERFCEDLQDLLELAPEKSVLFMVSFSCTVKWIYYTNTYIHPFLDSFPL